jgi:transcriptional regulator with XRE-family HTH domain
MKDKVLCSEQFKFPGQKIKMLRQRLGYNQRELAYKANMSPSALNRIESGHSIQPRKIVSIADILGCHPRELDFSPPSSEDNVKTNINLMKKMFPNWKDIVREASKEINKV